jgi:carbamoyltransferase
MDYVCNIYKLTTDQIWTDIKKNIDNFAHERGVVLGGGSALALEVNSLIHENVKDVVFGPPINDSGLALGAAAFGYWHTKKEWPKIIKSPSLNFLQFDLPKVGPQKPKEIAKIIASNKFVGLLREKSECGPRSLGFRSILANANRYENLKQVSEDIKGREFYRPLSPIVTEKSFDRYFIGPKGKYMQYKVKCKEETQKELPAVVHKDNSARPQVVCENCDPWLHDLLVEYGKLTGHECMINTSLNSKGKPICNTYQDAMDDFKNKNIPLISISKKIKKLFV